MSTILARLAEPSTWAGFGLIAGAVHALIASPANSAAWVTLLGGIIAVIKAEAGLA